MVSLNKRTVSAGIIIFFICQVIIDCLQSVTAFPFLHYGMFSEVYKSKETEIFEIRVNGKLLSSEEFNILTWDLIHSPLHALKKQIATEDFAFEKGVIKNGMNKFQLQNTLSFAVSNLDNNQSLNKEFPYWYKNHLRKLLDYEIKTVEITILHYNYKNGNYILLKKAKWIEA